MLIFSINKFCQELSPILQMVGQVINIFKISLPIILIILGILDIGKAVISSKSDDVKKNMKNFGKKIIACVCVFFLPLFCMIVFGFVGEFNEIKKYSGLDFDVCYDCMFNPSRDNCINAVEIAQKN